MTRSSPMCGRDTLRNAKQSRGPWNEHQGDKEQIDKR